MGTKTTSDLLIREFEPGDEVAFRTLNEAWIRQNFTMESKDEEAFSDPRKNILDPGGRIFLAVRDGETVACCALLPIGPGEFEIGKMTVAEARRGAGIGRQILTAVVGVAREEGATRLYLETNGILIPALRLYESLGFRRLPPERVALSPYTRSEIAMELYLTPDGESAG